MRNKIYQEITPYQPITVLWTGGGTWPQAWKEQPTQCYPDQPQDVFQSAHKCAAWQPSKRVVSKRLKIVSSTQKFTNSMKMVAAAKFGKAKGELKPARPYGRGAQVFLEKAEVWQDEKRPNHLLVPLTSDRGLCGATHVNIIKAVRARVQSLPSSAEFRIIPIGDKARVLLQRQYGKHILMHITQVGRKPLTFLDASDIANAILSCGFQYDFGEVYYNAYKSLKTYSTTRMPIITHDNVASARKISLYDSVDPDVLQSYSEFSLVSLISWVQKEGATSEESQRMTVMDKATRNAGKVIDKLNVKYNRTRQALITRELIEIISGTDAVK